MNFDWYLIFNMDEFMATGLTSKTYDIFLDGIGLSQIIVTRGNEVSVVYQDVMMPVLFQGDNPFVREGTDKNYAVYQDSFKNVYLGIEAL